MGTRQSLNPNEGPTVYEYLKKKIGIVPEALMMLESYKNGDSKKLIDDIPNLIKVLNDLDRIPDEAKVDSEIISGLLTLLTGSNKSLEKLAEVLRVKQELIELCLKMTAINQGSEEDIPARLLEFQQSPLISKVWSTLGISQDTIDAFLSLTFRTYKIDNPDSIFEKLNVMQHMDQGFLMLLLSITNSWSSIRTVTDTPMNCESQKRHQDIETLQKTLKPVCKRLLIDPDLALVGVRLRQGDFYIIDDYKDYLHILLPTDEVRKMAMGVCGILTHPARFTRNLWEYPDKFEHEISFEGATEMLCELFNINPMVARMTMMDKAALNEIETTFKISKKTVKRFSVI